MWNWIIPGFGETVYFYAIWFFMYSILGWAVESVYMTLCNRKLTNRGFVRGPLCPIYGFGGTIVHMAVKSLSGHYFYMFIAGSLLATAFEFITANIMSRMFGFVWWDYTNKPYNFRGIICLESSIAWGFYTIIESTVLYRLVVLAVGMISVRAGKTAILILSVYYALDLIYCLKRAKQGGMESDENNLLEYRVKRLQ